jgi:hypothetical protein
MKILTSFLGVDKTVAQTQIVSEGFTVGTVTQSDSTDAAELSNHNKVISQLPVALSLIDYDSAVDITWRNFSFTPYSFTPTFSFTPAPTFSFTPAPTFSFTPAPTFSFTPAPQITVPSVVGLSQIQAESTIQLAGLVLGSISTGSQTYVNADQGKVQTQSPVSGTLVASGSSVNITMWDFVGTPPTGGTIPDVVGLHVNLALAVISEEGFINAPVQGNSSVGATAANHQKVKSQNPAAGTTAPFNTNVQLVLFYYNPENPPTFSFTPFSFTPAPTFSFTPAPTFSFTPAPTFSFTPAPTFSFTPAGGGGTGCRGAKPYPYCICQSDTPGTMWVC